MSHSSSLATASSQTASKPGELIITREFNAPRALVWKAWTDPKHLAQWWGPRGYTTPTCEMDVRVGGALKLCMRPTEGTDIWVRGMFREVVENERLVFSGVDNANPASETVMTISFEDAGSKTRLTVHQTFAETEFARGAKEGWNSSLDRLTDYLSGLR